MNARLKSVNNLFAPTNFARGKKKRKIKMQRKMTHSILLLLLNNGNIA